MQGNHAAAEPLFQRSLAIADTVWGRAHPNYAAMLCNLADLRQAQKSWSEAERLYLETLAIAEKAYGPKHPVVAGYLSGYERVPEGMKRKKDAKEVAARIREIEMASGGPPGRHTVDVLALERR